MLKPIRIKLPSEDFPVYRTRPLRVSEFRDLLLIRYQMGVEPTEESIMIADEVLADLFPDAPIKYRPYIFLVVYCDSRGLDIVQIKHKCPACSAESTVGVSIKPGPLERPSMELLNGVTLNYNYTDPFDMNSLDFIGIVEKTIHSVSVGDEEYEWTELDQETKDMIIDSIDYHKFMEYIKGLSVIPAFPIQNAACCDVAKANKTDHIQFEGFYELFRFLLNPDEINLYYRSNKAMINSGFTLKDIEDMAPMEKSITLTLIEEELRRRSEANGNK